MSSSLRWLQKLIRRLPGPRVAVEAAAVRPQSRFVWGTRLFSGRLDVFLSICGSPEYSRAGFPFLLVDQGAPVRSIPENCELDVAASAISAIVSSANFYSCLVVDTGV